MILYNENGLGDCLFTCSMLRRTCGSHDFHCRPEHVLELSKLMGDKRHMILPLDLKPQGGINTWLGDTQFINILPAWHEQKDLMGYVMDYHNQIAKMISGEPAFHERSDMLWDSPAIAAKRDSVPQPEILIVNASPLSNQCPGYDTVEMNQLIFQLSSQHDVEVTSLPGRPNYSLAEIGAMSTWARLIIQAQSGPAWVTHNIWNANTKRVILSHPQVIDFGTPGMTQYAKDAQEALAYAELML